MVQEIRELNAEIREHKRILQQKIRAYKALCKKYGIPLTEINESDTVGYADKATT